LNLRAERKSKHTIEAYSGGVRRFLTWCTSTGTPPVLDRPTVAAFIGGLLDAGAVKGNANLSPKQLAALRSGRFRQTGAYCDGDRLTSRCPVTTSGCSMTVSSCSTISTAMGSWRTMARRKSRPSRPW
jgi:hypothetical protein